MKRRIDLIDPKEATRRRRYIDLGPEDPLGDGLLLAIAVVAIIIFVVAGAS